MKLGNDTHVRITTVREENHGITSTAYEVSKWGCSELFDYSRQGLKQAISLVGELRSGKACCSNQGYFIYSPIYQF